MVKYIGFGILFAILVLAMMGCEKDGFITDGSVTLRFSTDTLRFDTVFTELGSATRFVKVYNDEKRPIKISKVRLGSGSTSFFRMNVDGLPGNEITEVEIQGNDSIYIFAEVTVDPDNPISSSPFVIQEDLFFEINGNTQSIVLEAWGQNANYIPSRFNASGFALLSCDLGEVVWDDPKPYVIYGVLLIDSCTLTVPAGTQIYVHGGIARDSETIYNDGIVFVLPSGKLNFQGTLDEPIVIQDDRLEDAFEDVEGQWAGIRIGPGSTGNVMNHTTIKNSIVGLRVDSAASVVLNNCQMYNTASSALVGDHADIRATNCIFYNSNGYNVQLEYGGIYRFTSCTLTPCGVNRASLRMTNLRCRDELCSDAAIFPLDVKFRNSIIFGSRTDEIELADWLGGTAPFFFKYEFENCIVRVDELTDPEFFPDFFTYCDPCWNLDFGDVLFADPNDDDYHLDTLSFADGKAVPFPGVTIDLEGNDRDPNNPDLGCYEYIIQ